MWRKYTDDSVIAYPSVLEVRPLTVSEWRKVEQLDEDAKQAFVLESCTKVDGVPGSTALDVHVATALIRGVMANPWIGPQPTA
jgi:hypothetical protein